jgi:putative Mg2+ transporter-C (MgtC) family protein
MIEWNIVLLRLFIAAVLGALVGLERERKNWTAGMRTHMMVCLGSCLIMIVSAYGFNEVLNQKNVTLDPSRVAAQVISGIGFIGAGTILFLKQGIIRGLTTASGLWTVAGIGLACGGGMYFAAAVTTAFALIILFVLQPFEKKLSKRFKNKTIHITTKDKSKSSEIIHRVLENDELEISNYHLDKEDNEFLISFRFKTINKVALKHLMDSLQSDNEVTEITWNQ